MSEFRQDIVSKNWVLISGERAKRPHAFDQKPANPKDLPEIDEKCVFCPGNEKKTPSAIAVYPKIGKWKVRVVPNKFSALTHVLGKRTDDFYVSRPGIGDHEVVITRNHNQPTATQSEEMIDLTLKVYIDRINDLRHHDEIHYVHIIQNHGAAAGGSIVHPHSQIFATPFMPERLHDELKGTRDYFELNGVCVYCDIIMKEIKANKRIVLDTEDFLVMTPYASKMPYQMRILPKRHMAHFHEMSNSERKSLARVMKEIFSRIYHKMNNPAYNYYIHTMPCDGENSQTFNHELSYHWHMIIMPRINIWAGFELGTEVYVDPVSPEDAAEFLRESI